jgi:hypothetical protein
MKYLLISINRNPLNGGIMPENVAVIKHKRHDEHFDKPNHSKVWNALNNHFKSGISLGQFRKVKNESGNLSYKVNFQTGVWESEPKERKHKLTAFITEIELY